MDFQNLISSKYIDEFIIGTFKIYKEPNINSVFLTTLNKIKIVKTNKFTKIFFQMYLEAQNFINQQNR